jgi:hypothetical protein
MSTAGSPRARGEDPFDAQGLPDIEIKEWMLMEGAITATLDFVPGGRLQNGDAREGSEFAR